ncbi:MAG: xylose isomerase [Gemmatimonadetes bacterium]|nr:xylose isomerase [Gemmatimonadota bacterium]
MLRIGVGMRDAPEDPDALAERYVNLGYNAAVWPRNPNLDEPERVKALQTAFEKRDVLIAEVGAWCNIISPDEEECGKNIDYVCDRLALADEVGACCCVDFLGGREPGIPWSEHPDNFTDETFDLCVETVRSIIDRVKPTRTRFTIETMQCIIPDNVDSYVDLFNAVDRPQFAVHVDPANLILTPRMIANTGALIRNYFDRLGSWIVSCHAKDLIVHPKLALHIDEVRPGLGRMDYRTYLKEIDKLDREVPLILEHLDTMEEYGKAREFILSQVE